jgi:hypothetical protein
VASCSNAGLFLGYRILVIIIVDSWIRTVIFG